MTEPVTITGRVIHFPSPHAAMARFSWVRCRRCGETISQASLTAMLEKAYPDFFQGNKVYSISLTEWLPELMKTHRCEP